MTTSSAAGYCVRSTAKWLAGLAVCLAITATAPARPVEPVPDAKQEQRINSLVEVARKHRQAADYDRAIDALREALAINAAPWLFYSLARVYEDAGKTDLARSYYSLCVGPNADPETRARAEEGLFRLDKIGERGRLQLRVTPVDARIEIDGEVWSPDVSGTIQLTAGPHQLIVSHADYVPYQQSVDINGGQSTTVVVRLNLKPPVKPDAEPQAPHVDTYQRPAPPEPNHTAPTAIIVAGGVFVLGGVAFQIWAGDAATRATQASDAEAYEVAVSDLEFRQGLAIAAFAVGGAAIITGTIWILADSPDDASHAGLGLGTESFSVVPGVGPDYLGVTCNGTF